MKIYAVLLVKDEADVIRSVLSAAALWADAIFVLDNGSTDGTWDILQSIADETVIPWKQDLQPYRRSLRADIFNEFRSRATSVDWWCNMDSDEFYVDDPREFLSQVPPRYHVVYKKSIDYVITHEDLEEHSFSGRFEDDQAKLRYLNPTSWVETRFFRHRNRLQWTSVEPGATDLPVHVGLHYPRPILARHYQYRSPEQIQRRLDVRNAIPRDETGRPFKHIRQTKWQELLVSRDKSVLDQGRKTYEALPQRSAIQERWTKRVVKRFMHGMGLWP